jgi:hypothetical protein
MHKIAFANNTDQFAGKDRPELALPRAHRAREIIEEFPLEIGKLSMAQSQDIVAQILLALSPS